MKRKSDDSNHVPCIDESGTHRSSPISVMAGYLGTASQWERFDGTWSELVRAAGLSRIHAADLVGRRNELEVGNGKTRSAFVSRSRM